MNVLKCSLRWLAHHNLSRMHCSTHDATYLAFAQSSVHTESLIAPAQLNGLHSKQGLKFDERCACIAPASSAATSRACTLELLRGAESASEVVRVKQTSSLPQSEERISCAIIQRATWLEKHTSRCLAARQASAAKVHGSNSFGSCLPAHHRSALWHMVRCRESCHPQ